MAFGRQKFYRRPKLRSWARGIVHKVVSRRRQHKTWHRGYRGVAKYPYYGRRGGYTH